MHVIVPPVQELPLGDVGHAAQNPGVLKVQVRLVVADHHHIVPRVVVHHVGCTIILPGLDLHNDRPAQVDVVLQFADAHALPELGGQVQGLGRLKEHGGGGAVLGAGLGRAGEVGLALGDLVVAQHGGQTGGAAGVVSRLHDVGHVEHLHDSGSEPQLEGSLCPDQGGVGKLVVGAMGSSQGMHPETSGRAKAEQTQNCKQEGPFPLVHCAVLYTNVRSCRQFEISQI